MTMLTNRLTGAPIAPFQSLSRELDRMFEGLLDGAGVRQGVPAVSIWEDEERFYLEAEVPGIQSDDLDISVTGNRVTLKGERKEHRREKATLHRQEWGGYRFERTFELPVDVDGDHIKAELRQGVLTLELPKAPQHKPRKIKVVASE